MRRAAVAWTLVALLVAALGGVVWLTRHPDVAWLARAEGWPLVGSLAAAFRRTYLPLPPSPSGGSPGAGEAGGGVSFTYVPEADEEAGPAAAEAIRGTGEFVWLEPGMALLAAPAEGAAEVYRAPLIANVEVLERRGRWVRVEFRRRSGWVEMRRAAGSPPLGSAPEPPRPLAASPPDPTRLATALGLLGVARPAGELGPYPVYTDVGDPDLLAFLDRVAAAVDGVYRRRYGRPPVGEAAEAVVLFARAADYRAFQASEPRLAGLAASGHSGFGLVALPAAGGREELAGTLVHELTHLLNRRALGPALPPWLDEGMAGDLGGCRVSPQGGIEPAELGGEATRSARRVEFSGSRAQVRHLAEARDGGRLPPLAALFARPWEEFVAPPAAELDYGESATLVRYLLDGEGGRLAPGFRSFLAAVSAGEPASGAALAAHLGQPWARTEAGWRTWLLFTDQAIRLAAGL
jgi:hypothetical protein